MIIPKEIGNSLSANGEFPLQEDFYPPIFVSGN